jgi:PPM family protein phosphatase
MALSIQAAGRTHVGLVRRRNEDSLYVGQSLFAVADGLGGHPSGDVASQTVISVLEAHDRAVPPAELATTLGHAIAAANDTLRRKIEADPDLADMGSTLVAMFWSGETAVLANVGDSRVYLRQGEDTDSSIVQVTEDHTYGHLVADAASVPNLPERLVRWLDGRADGRSPDLTTWRLHPGQRFLLCSDGLSSYVPMDLTAAALSSTASPSDVADQLIALAIDQGGPDNVTVVVADIRD